MAWMAWNSVHDRRYKIMEETNGDIALMEKGGSGDGDSSVAADGSKGIVWASETPSRALWDMFSRAKVRQ